MAHRIDAEHDQDVGQGAVVSLRPGTTARAANARPAPQPAAPHPAREPETDRKPVWDKNNFGFWLVMCILASLAFSIVYRALG